MVSFMNILSFSDYHDRKALSRNEAQGRFFAKDTIDILRGSLYNRNKEGDGVSDVAKRIGGLLFEWDEEKARVNGQNTVFLLKQRLWSFKTARCWNFSIRSIVKMKRG